MVFKLTRQIGLLKMNLLSYAQKISGRAIFFRIATLACYMGFWASGGGFPCPNFLAPQKMVNFREKLKCSE